MSDNNREPKFYYSRERRLERASQMVRDSYEQKKRRGLIGFFGSKGNVMIFLCIILIIAMAGLGNYINRINDGLRLGGNIVELTLVREEGNLVLALLKRVPARGEIFFGDVDIMVTPAGTAPDQSEPFVHRVVFSPVQSETFIIALPFIEDDFFVILRTMDEQRAIRLQP